VEAGARVGRGNTAVFKPAELTPLTAGAVVRIFEDAGTPAGVLNMVLGAGEEIGDELVNHPDIRRSLSPDRMPWHLDLFRRRAPREKMPVRNGGKNPVIVLDDADLPLAVEASVFGAFGSAGQRCTATSRVIVEESVADPFVTMLVDRARMLKVGDGLAYGIDVGPWWTKRRWRAFFAISKSEG